MCTSLKMKEEKWLVMSMSYKPEIVVFSPKKQVMRREIAGPTKTGIRRIQAGRQKI